VNILVVLEIPGMAGPTMYIFIAWKLLKGKEFNNCGFFGQKFIVFSVYVEV
jgi:hypothetical protein